MGTSSIQFLEYQKPALESGDYGIHVEQSIWWNDRDSDRFESSLVKFSVYGERFSLDPSAVHAVFPPPGSLGDFSNVLPHIALRRSTFPWERPAGKMSVPDASPVPWVALLLFDETEIKDKTIVQSMLTLDHLLPGGQSPGIFAFPDIALETGQLPSDKVTVIDVEKSLLEAVMPSREALRMLAHVRKRANTGPETVGQVAPDTELAVVVCNRHPKTGFGCTAHLVSVENRYSGGGFDFRGAGGGDYIRLVSLKSWSFTCFRKEGSSFAESLRTLDAGTLHYPYPDFSDESVKNHVSRGYVLLPHHVRQGDFTYSWYHSPLTSQRLKHAFDPDKEAPECGDALLRYHADTGMLDVAYAAAFELGRVLALESQVFAATLYRWKHACATRWHAGKQRDEGGLGTLIVPGDANRARYCLSGASRAVLRFLYPDLTGSLRALHAALNGQEETAGRDAFEKRIDEILSKCNPGTVEQGIRASLLEFASEDGRRDAQAFAVLLSWLDELALLKHIPFNYLAPDEKMLPPESIRFFTVDLYWLECLLSGALSIGSSHGEDLDLKRRMGSAMRLLVKPFLTGKSGFIIRSALVSGYPDMLVDAGAEISAGDGPLAGRLPAIRMERLAPDVLFCLFAGDVGTADLFLRPEGLHFGLENVGTVNGRVAEETGVFTFPAGPAMNPARFARIMLARPPKRRFTVG